MAAYKNKNEVIDALGRGEITPASAKQAIEALDAAAAKARQKPITLKAGEKGGVSVYGLQRFPVTLYPQQMLRLLDHAAEIREFIETNKDSLTFKE